VVKKNRATVRNVNIGARILSVAALDAPNLRQEGQRSKSWVRYLLLAWHTKSLSSLAEAKLEMKQK
jgi:hypothetical protein